MTESKIQVQQPAVIAPPSHERHSTFGYMLAMALITAGPTAVDQITANMISITAKHFTTDAFVITWIIALNRLFGFLVQPYIAWKSDHIQTKYGRRRPYFLIGIPATTLFMLLVGLMPVFVKSDSLRHSMGVLVIFTIVNVLMQAFQDVTWGSQEPLYADTFRHRMLGRAVAIRNYSNQIIVLIMSYGAMRLADTNELYPYLVCALLMVLSFFNVLLFIKEKKVEVTAKPERYNPLKHLGLLFKNMDYLRISLISALWLVLLAVFGLFQSLFAIETLQLTKSQLAVSLLFGPIIAFAMSWPAGYLIDRFGPKPMLFIGFFLFLVTSAFMAFVIQPFQRNLLLVLLCLFNISSVLMAMPMTSLVFQYTAPHERGEVFGLIQFVRGFSAFVFSLVLGAAVKNAPSYDTMPIYDKDFKVSAAAFANDLYEDKREIAKVVRDGLSENVRAQLNVKFDEKSKTFEDFRAAIVKDLNAIAKAEPLYIGNRFDNIELSRQSRRFVDQSPKNADEEFLFNRILLHDAFPDAIAMKQDYRVAYIICIVLSILACILTLTARKGKYAETIKDAEYVEL